MISSDKTRIPLTLTHEMKEQLQKIAKEEGRSVNNLIEYVLQQFISNRSEK